MSFAITSRFGDISSVRGNVPHTGIDISMPEGTELKSMVEGIVSKVLDENVSSLGKAIYVKTAEGKEYIYGHLSDVTVRIGDYVTQSQVIALSGNTGNSTGPHLHFAIKDNGQYVNPESELMQVANSGVGEFEYLNPFYWIQKLTDKVEEGIAEVDKEIANDVASTIGENMTNAISELAVNVWNFIVTWMPDIVGYSALFCGGLMMLSGLLGYRVTKPLGTFAAVLTVGSLIRGAV